MSVATTSSGLKIPPLTVIAGEKSQQTKPRKQR